VSGTRAETRAPSPWPTTRRWRTSSPSSSAQANGHVRSRLASISATPRTIPARARQHAMDTAHLHPRVRQARRSWRHPRRDHRSAGKLFGASSVEGIAQDGKGRAAAALFCPTASMQRVRRTNVRSPRWANELFEDLGEVFRQVINADPACSAALRRVSSTVASSPGQAGAMAWWLCAAKCSIHGCRAAWEIHIPWMKTTMVLAIPVSQAMTCVME
jgi:hypothetical protein